MPAFLKSIIKHWVPALIMASGAYFGAIYQPVPVDEPSPNDVVSVDDTPTPTLTPTPTAQSASTRMFGKWEKGLKPGRIYKAASDGFIAVYTSGENPAGGVLIHVGDRPTEIAFDVLTRAGRYDGTVCPVAKGQYWKVEVRRSGGITVHWLPILGENEQS